ncbi:helix-turn-helix transcriptional regulator [Ekhidna sp.]|uniref:helix-turn-helix domain-containing protein n=1 Tax=Ekhidna sp. TaxID=2608089 RepID=UPI003298EAEA
MNLSFVNLILLIAAFHGAVLASIILLSKRFDHRGKVFLTMLIFVMSILVARNELEEIQLIQKYIVIYILSWGLPIFIGPLLYLYIRKLIVGKTSLRKHLIVPLLYYTFLAYGLLNGITTDEAVVSKPMILNFYLAFQLFIVLQLPYYLYRSWQLIRAYQSDIRNHYSNLNKISLRWLLYIVSATSILYLIWMIVYGGDVILFDGVVPLPDVNIVTFMFALLIFSIGYLTMLRPELFQVTLQRLKNSPNSLITFNEEDAVAFKSKIEEALNRQCVYLNQKLTVNDLAESINLSPKITSQLINKIYKISFYDLINTYRLEEVKKNLLDQKNKHLTIEGIALNSGFNSSSTFNRLFKVHTGQTPKAFRSSAFSKII